MAMESLSTMDELDSEPTLEEIHQALDQIDQKEHSSRNYMRYFANAGGKVRFHRT